MNKKKIIIIALIILIIGMGLVTVGMILISKNVPSSNPSVSNSENQDVNDIDFWNESEQFDKGLIFGKFKTKIGEDENDTLLIFSLLNNTNSKFKSNIMKINIYNSKNEIVKEYEYEMEDLELNDEVLIEANIDLKYKNDYVYEVVLGDTKTIVKANTNDVYKIN